MRTADKRSLYILIILLTVTPGVCAQSPREQLAQLVQQLKQSPSDNALREKIIKSAAEIKPAPAVSADAERFEGRAQFAFKDAKNEAEMLDAAREYLKAVEAAPWVPGYYLDLCTFLSKANRPLEAMRSCKLYLVAAPDEAEASEVRKKIAGLEYALEKMKGAASNRHSCNEYEDLYIGGAKVAQFGSRRITLKLISPLVGGIHRNQLFIADITDTSRAPAHMRNLDPLDEVLQIESQSYYLSISRDGRITLTGRGVSGGIDTSITELTKLRNDQLSSCWVVSKQGKYSVALAQGGPAQSRIDGAFVAGTMFFDSDCAGKLLSDKPGWLPDLFIKYEDEAILDTFNHAATDACAKSGGSLGWLSQ